MYCGGGGSSPETCLGPFPRRVSLQGYRGVPIHSLYRDEVQDFTQAELLLDMRVVADPNRFIRMLCMQFALVCIAGS